MLHIFLNMNNSYYIVCINTHLFGRVTNLQPLMSNSLNDSKDANISSGKLSDRLFSEISNTSRLLSEHML